jgi:hypothetical protein
MNTVIVSGGSHTFDERSMELREIREMNVEITDVLVFVSLVSGFFYFLFLVICYLK